MNSINAGIVTGRLVNDPIEFVNKDGSKAVIIKLAVNEGKDTYFPELYGYIAKDKVDSCKVYDYLHQGMPITVQYKVITSNFKKDGKTIYSQKLSISNIVYEGKTQDGGVKEEIVLDDVPF